MIESSTRNCSRGSATLLTLLTGSILSCGGGSCGDVLAVGDVCPSPVYGYARVAVTVLQLDGTPAAGRQGFVNCGDVVGSYGDLTNSAGQFVAEPVYSNFDTLFSPHPPRTPDGGFLVNCRVNAEVRRDVFASDSVAVPFAPTRIGVTPIAVELREPGP
jgi:hypothetical protein